MIQAVNVCYACAALLFGGSQDIAFALPSGSIQKWDSSIPTHDRRCYFKACCGRLSRYESRYCSKSATACWFESRPTSQVANSLVRPTDPLEHSKQRIGVTVGKPKSQQTSRPVVPSSLRSRGLQATFELQKCCKVQRRILRFTPPPLPLPAACERTWLR